MAVSEILAYTDTTAAVRISSVVSQLLVGEACFRLSADVSMAPVISQVGATNIRCSRKHDLPPPMPMYLLFAVCHMDMCPWYCQVDMLNNSFHSPVGSRISHATVSSSYLRSLLFVLSVHRLRLGILCVNVIGSVFHV